MRKGVLFLFLDPSFLGYMLAVVFSLIEGPLLVVTALPVSLWGQLTLSVLPGDLGREKGGQR